MPINILFLNAPLLINQRSSTVHLSVGYIHLPGETIRSRFKTANDSMRVTLRRYFGATTPL